MYWENDWGDTFDTEEEARNTAMEQMTIDNYFDRLFTAIDHEDLLRWAWNQPNFLDDFMTEISAVEDDFFESHYHELDN